MEKFKNFEKTLGDLKSYLALPIQTDRDRAGIIQAFEFTFEQSWKAIQKVAGDQGVQIASPKTAFSFALQSGWILQNQEPSWIQLIQDRNLTTDTYEEKLAREILGRIQSQYASMFEGLLQSLKAA